MSYVSKGIKKKDAMSLVTGKGVYTGDTVPAGALRLKLLRSPHAPMPSFVRSTFPGQNRCPVWSVY